MVFSHKYATIQGFFVIFMTTQNTARKIEVDEEVETHHWWDTPLDLLGLREKAAANDEIVSANDEFEITEETKEKNRESLKAGTASKEVIDSHIAMRGSKSERFVLGREIEVDASDDHLLEDVEEIAQLKERAREMGVDVEKEGWKKELAERLRLAKKGVAGISQDGEKMSKEKMHQLFEEALTDFGNGQKGKRFKAKEFNMKTLGELAKKSWEKTEGRFFLLRPFLFIKEMMAYGLKWKAVKKFEKEIGAYQEAKEKGEELKDKTKEEREKIKEGYRDYRRAKTPIALNPAALEALRSLKVSYKDRMHGVISMLLRKKINGKEALDQIQIITKDVVGRGTKEGKAEFMSLVGKKEFAGLRFKKVGKFMAIEVFQRGIMEAIEQRRFGAFAETITDSDTLWEAVPGVGSWNSVKRLFIDNGEPAWAKWLDAGLNVAGDAYLLVLTAGSFGTGTPLAVAGRMGIISAGKSLIKKQLAKEGIKRTTQEVIVKEGVKQGVKKSGKVIGGAWRFAKNNWGTAAITLGVALDGLIPEGKVTEIATDVLVGSLDEGDRALLDVADVQIPKAA